MDNNKIAGFELLTLDSIPNRLIVCIEGLEKDGKTWWWCTAPGPSFCFNMDLSTKNTARLFTGNKIALKDYFPANRSQDAHVKVIEQFDTDLDKVIKVPDFRTIVIDNATTLWHNLRMAEFGKVTQVMPHQYTLVNTIMQTWLNKLNNCGKNIIYTHRLDKEYKKMPGDKQDSWTGAYERKGYGKIGFEVQVIVRVFSRWDHQTGINFISRVEKSALNGYLAGKEYMNADSNFQSLAIDLLPEVDPALWY